MNKKLSIISPIMCLNEETAKMTERMILDIKKEIKDRDDVEFIIVDNASTYGQEKMMEGSDIYISLPENRGWGGGLNVGMKIASGDFFLCANNDIEIEPGWIDLLYNRFDSSQKIGTISIHDTPGFSGSFFAFRREVYEKIGGFDEKNFPLGHAQDCDFLYRLLIEGWDFNVLEYVNFKHFNRQTYDQSEFYKIYGKHHNFHDSTFEEKWGFSPRQWAIGRRHWIEKIKKDPSLDRFKEFKNE